MRMFCLFVALGSIAAPADEVAVVVHIDPSTTRAVGGCSDLVRERFFSIADAGTDLSVLSPERYNYYLRDLGMTFGRRVNLLHAAWRWGHCVFEDPKRPGYVDLERMKETIRPVEPKGAPGLESIFPGRLDNVATENFLAETWPPFMETYFRPQDTQHRKAMASNVDAAAEAMIAYLKYGFTDYTRPTLFEGLNEPLWFHYADPNIAAFSLKCLQYARQFSLDVKVGGPCYPGARWYNDSYQELGKTLGRFIDETHGKLDFYAFHTYNHLGWDAAQHDFRGGISAGMPLEGCLDALENYTVTTFGRQVDLVVTEHGAYVPGSGPEGTDHAVRRELIPGDDWQTELKRKSIFDFIMVDGAIAHTLTFMNHPHVVRKAMPYVLLETVRWEPRHYASLLVSENYEVPATTLDESRLIDFWKFFRDVRGRYVQTRCADPDLQHQAFVDGSRLILLYHNLAPEPRQVRPTVAGERTPIRVVLRRYGRNPDFTPRFEETAEPNLPELVLAAYESAAILLDYPRPLAEQRRVHELPYYGDRVATVLNGREKLTCTINVPQPQQALDAELRVSLGRPHGTDRQVKVGLNGHDVRLPVEAAAPLLDAENRFAKGYGTMRSARVEAGWLREVNTVEVSFPDGQGGGVGSVVLRVTVPDPNQVAARRPGPVGQPAVQ